MKGHCPHNANGGKTRHKSEERYLLAEQLIEQCAIVYYTMWHLDTEYKQCNSNGEDAIAKSFQAVSFFFIHTLVILHFYTIQGISV
jgi:hypothetical protein